MITSGVNFIPEHPVGAVVELAGVAEGLGYDRCWVYDEGLATRDVYVTMTAVAAATERIRIGPGITNPYTRHPATTAAAVASLDEVSSGRAFLGIGAGGSLTLAPLGIDRRRPVTAVRETIEACRRLWSGEVCDLDGASTTLRGARLAYGRADIEVWLAGRGPRMLGLGGAAADGVMLDFIHRDVLGDYTSLIAAGAARTGNSPAVCYSTMIITDDKAMADTKPHMTYRLVDSPPQVRDLIGLTDRDAGRIREAMADGLHAAGELIPDEWVHPFVIAGSPAECAAALGDVMECHGFDEFLLPIYEIEGAAALMETVAGVLAAV